MMTLVLFLFLCLVLSAFLSGSEMAFISCNKIKIRELAEQGDRSAQKIRKLQEHPQHFLTSILIGNNIANVAATALFTYGLETYFSIHNEWVIAGLMTPILLIFGETVPKDYCRQKAQVFLFKYADPLVAFIQLLYFPSLILLRAIDVFLGPLGTAVHRSIFVSEEEFRSLIEETTKSGLLEKHEKQIIDTILDFERIHLDSVMTPLSKAPKIDLKGTVKLAKEIAQKTHARALLVYEEVPTIIVGIVYIFDLLFEKNDDQGLKNFLRAPMFLPGNTSIEKAFLMLQEKRQSYTVVTDATSEAIGMVPIEKLLVV